MNRTTTEPSSRRGAVARQREAFERIGMRTAGLWILFLTGQFLLFGLFFFQSRNQALENLRAERVREIRWQERLADERGSARPDAPMTVEEIEAVEPLTFDGRSDGYTPAEARAMLGALGPEGRSIYVGSQLALDMVFPILYALLGVVVLAALGTALPTQSVLRRHAHWAVWAPLGMAGVDLVENWLSLVIVRGFEAGSLSDSLLRLASAATRLKFLFGGLALAAAIVLALALMYRHRSSLVSRGLAVASRWLPYLMLIRVQLIFGVLLLIMARLGRASLPTIENLMIVESTAQMAILTFICLQAGGVIGFTLLLTWGYAHARFGLAEIPLQGPLARPGVARTLWFGFLGLPLIVQIAFSSMTPPNGVLGIREILAGLIIGLALATALAAIIELVRLQLLERLVRRAPRLLVRLAKLHGPGYWEPNGPSGVGRILPAHVLAGVGTGALAILYAAGFLYLDPLRESPLADLYPTLSYVIIMLVLLGLIVAGSSFFFDRFRVPVVLPLGLYLVLMAIYVPRDHYFEATLADRTLRPSPSDAVAKRWQQPRGLPEGGRVITIVTLDGGGIQASAWAAEVLTGLHAALGEEFTRSIALVSSVSGGSVGAMYFLEALDDETGLPRDEALAAVRRAAQRSSLEATAWGLVYPDFLRAFLPFLDRLPIAAGIPALSLDERDRAWAMERAWLRTVSDMRRELDPRAPHEPLHAIRGSRLSQWAERAKQGSMPGVVLNATVVEDGQQFWVSNLDLEELDRPRDPPVSDPALLRHYKAIWEPGATEPASLEASWLDMPVVTGARLSATFPWVTPLARARIWGDDGRPSASRVSGYHVADGGYFDNFGTVAALSWLNAVAAPEDADVVLVVEVRSFAVETPGEPAENRGWAFATVGPLEALLRVRTSSQAGRNDLEIELARQLRRWVDGRRLEHVVIRPPLLEGRREPPLSWHLSRSDKRQICRDWLLSRRDVEAQLGDLFPNRLDQWPSDETCNARMTAAADG